MCMVHLERICEYFLRFAKYSVCKLKIKFLDAATILDTFVCLTLSHFGIVFRSNLGIDCLGPNNDVVVWNAALGSWVKPGAKLNCATPLDQV